MTDYRQQARDMLRGMEKQPDHFNEPYGGHELGKTYWCDYWQDAYTVEVLHDNHWSSWAVTVKWHGDGRRTTHCTSRGKRDIELPA